MRVCFLVVFCCALGVPALHGQTVSRVTSVVRADAKSGKLVRSVVLRGAPKASSAIPAKKTTSQSGIETNVQALVEAAARAHDVDPLLVHSVIEVESAYNQYAISPKGAQGLMQLMPATARRFGVQNSFDARENIEGGVRYLRHLQELYKDQRLALAAYNAGEGAVAKYGNVPPYPETMSYVWKVGRKYERRRAGSDQTKLAQALAKPAEPEPFRRLEAVMDENGRVYLRTR